MKFQKAFTLIELLVVISILGLLSSIVLISMEGATDLAEEKKAMEFAHVVRVSLGADLVGEWRFDEASGTEAKDSSGYDNHGTLSNFDGTADSGWVTGIFSSALAFDGDNDRVDCGNPAILTNAEAITYSLWLKPAELYDSSKTVDWDLMRHGSSHYTLLRLDDAAGKARFFTNTVSSAYSSETSWEAGTWYYIVGTYDKNAGSDEVKIYVNGDLSGTNTDTSDISAPDSALIINGGGQNSHGIIDDVRIYNQALSSAEIQQHYAQGAIERNIALK